MHVWTFFSSLLFLNLSLSNANKYCSLFIPLITALSPIDEGFAHNRRSSKLFYSHWFCLKWILKIWISGNIEFSHLYRRVFTHLPCADSAFKHPNHWRFHSHPLSSQSSSYFLRPFQDSLNQQYSPIDIGLILKVNDDIHFHYFRDGNCYWTSHFELCTVPRSLLITFSSIS